MFSIVKNYKIFFSITIIFLLIGFGSIVTRGFNLELILQAAVLLI